MEPHPLSYIDNTIYIVNVVNHTTVIHVQLYGYVHVYVQIFN